MSVDTIKPIDDDALNAEHALSDTFSRGAPTRNWHLLSDTDQANTQRRVLDLTRRAEHYAVGVHKGLMTTAYGDTWDTFGEEAKFVMRGDGQVFGSTKFRENGVSLHHSSFLKEPVAAAGLAVVNAGKPQYFICDSGHYQPTAMHMAQFLQRLSDDGVCLLGVRVGFHGTDSDDFLWVTAEDCLALGEDSALLERAIDGPDRSGKKDKAALSRSSTRSFLSSGSSTRSG